MRIILMLITILSIFCSCSNTDAELEIQKSQIVAVTRCATTTEPIDEALEDSLVFTGNNIAWFNPNSREIKFSTIKSGVFSIPPYAYIDIKMGNEVLFTIVAHVNGSVNRSYDDLVLFYDLETSKYYLYDNYPNYWNPEATQININKRAKGWTKFLEQLKNEGKLK